MQAFTTRKLSGCRGSFPTAWTTKELSSSPDEETFRQSKRKASRRCLGCTFRSHTMVYLWGLPSDLTQWSISGVCRQISHNGLSLGCAFRSHTMVYLWSLPSDPTQWSISGVCLQIPHNGLYLESAFRSHTDPFRSHTMVYLWSVPSMSISGVCLQIPHNDLSLECNGLPLVSAFRSHTMVYLWRLSSDPTQSHGLSPCVSGTSNTLSFYG